MCSKIRLTLPEAAMTTRPWRIVRVCIMSATLASEGALAQTSPVVSGEWDEIERVVLQDGTVQIRVRPKPAPAAALALTPLEKVDTKSLSSAEEYGAVLVNALRERLAVDLSVPASPAMAVLGISGTEIDRPAFPRDLAASVIRGFDKDGKNRDAFAIDIVPASLWFRSSVIGGDQYINHSWTMQVLARTTLSLGAAKVEDSSEGSQYGAGIRIGLIDRSDPGLYWVAKEDCVRPFLQKQSVEAGRVTGGSRTITQDWIKDIQVKCKLDNLVADLWAKPALYVGYAQGWKSDTRSVRDASGNAKAFWASFSAGLNPRTEIEVANGASGRTRALLQLYLARKIDERISNPTGADNFVREDRTEFVTRLRFGKVKWHGYVEAGAARTRTAGLERESIRRVGFGVEYMLRDDLWLVLGSLRETGFRDGTRSLLNTGLRFSQAPKGLFGLPDLAGK
jgi:hypothetical protein